MSTVLALLLSACLQAQEKPAEWPSEPGVIATRTIEVLETGTGEKVRLELQPEKGVRHHLTWTMDESAASSVMGGMKQDAIMPATRLELTVDLSAREEPDAWTCRVSFDEPEVTVPESATALQRIALGPYKVQVEAMTERPIEWHADGSRVWLSAEALELVEGGKVNQVLGLLPWMSMTPLFPSEPVGVGARWRVRGLWDSEGLMQWGVPFERVYEVVGIGDRFVEISESWSSRGQDVPISETSPMTPGSAEGRVLDFDQSGKGSSFYCRRTGLLEEHGREVRARLEFSVSIGGNEMVMLTETDAVHSRTVPRELGD